MDPDDLNHHNSEGAEGLMSGMLCSSYTSTKTLPQNSDPNDPSPISGSSIDCSEISEFDRLSKTSRPFNKDWKAMKVAIKRRADNLIKNPREDGTGTTLDGASIKENPDMPISNSSSEDLSRSAMQPVTRQSSVPHASTPSTAKIMSSDPVQLLGIETESVTVEDMLDANLRSKIQDLLDLSGITDIAYLSDVLQTCGYDVKVAALVLTGELTEKIRREVRKLMNKYKNATEEHALGVLLECHGDIDKAMTLLGEQLVEGKVSIYVNRIGRASNITSNLAQGSILEDEADFEASVLTLHEIFNGVYDMKRIRTVLKLANNDPDLAFRELDMIGGAKLDYHSSYESIQQEDNGEGPSQKAGLQPFNSASILEFTSHKRSRRATSEKSADCQIKRLKDDFAVQEPEHNDRVDYDDIEEMKSTSGVEGSGFEPAGQWLKRYFPGGSLSTVLLGPAEVVRDTIPRTVLCTISPFFLEHFAAIDAREKPDQAAKMPDLCPDMFDLAIQYAVTGNIRLELSCQRLSIDDITILIDLVHVCRKYRFPDPSEAVKKVLRNILIRKRSLLKNIHIRKIYELSQGNPLRNLVAKAVVQHFMKTNKSKQDEEWAYESEDDEYLKEGEVADKYRHSFRYERTLLSDQTFEYDVLREMKQVDSNAIVKPVMRGSRIMRKERQVFFADPLNGEQWSSDWVGRSDV